MIHVFTFDVITGEVEDKAIYPAQVTEESASWLYASNNKYHEDSVDSDKVGKWMLFVPRNRVDSVWDQIKAGIRGQQLWHAKVSTMNANPTHAIMVYTKDYTDLADVIRVLDYLESADIKPRHKDIRYKTDQQTLSGVYSGGAQKPWIYDSGTIRSSLTPNSNALPTQTLAGASREGFYVIPALRNRVTDPSERLVPPGKSSQPAGSFPQ